ncbi:amino acid adenylation domain-containing protein [Coleofasciculus sp. G2-EDA-02]|uniref:amino acid adenylation domain-containing protein n=1 Tax=Coleofasciculus sp. G2-EDA-02 TaxID=3069529 RepID=UPI0033019B94
MMNRFYQSSLEIDQLDGIPDTNRKRELKQRLEQLNQTQTQYPAAQCIHQLIEKGERRTPDKIAIRFEGQTLTYRELNHRANQVAHYLQTLQVKPEVLVGICMERSLDMVIGLLGILKAGGAYVPLDPAYPQERLALMIEDSQVTVLVTEQEQLTRLPDTQARVVCLDRDQQAITKHSQENLDSGVTPDNLAYTIYTSGSTGKPKGVQVLHRGVVNFLTSMSIAPGLTPDDTLLAVTTICFDIAALELYLPLIVGADIVLVTRDVAADAAQLIPVLRESGATVMQATPATWRMLLAAGWQGNPQLKVLCGGEPMSRELARQLLERSGSLWNMYGPTETTIWSAVHKVESAEKSIPIGRPIANTQIYLAHPEQNSSDPIKFVPLEEPGELLIGGVGLARGYLNRPDLTDERFIPDPFSLEPDARLYRTGDLARYLPDGSLECLGRLDHQVKIRGFRIELGDIESALYQHGGIRDAVVVARDDSSGEKRLVAYLVSDLNVENIPLQTTCWVAYQGNPEIELTTSDFSCDRITLINGTAPWQNGQSLTLRCQFPGVPDELKLTGTIVTKSQERIEVRLNTTPTQQALLRQSIKHIAQTQGLVVHDLRRKEPRIPLNINCLAELESGEKVRVMTQNISQEGICLKVSTSELWQTDQRLLLRLQLPGVETPLWLQGIIVWHFEDYVGVKFDTTTSQKAKLHRSLGNLRTEPRIPLQINCLAEFESGQQVGVTTQNFSRNGISLKALTPTFWQNNQPILLRVQLPGVQNPLWLHGTVAWHVEENAGVIFETTPTQQEQIHQSIEHIIKTQGLSLAQLRSFLSDKLPAYMVPSTFVLLDSLPLTPNRKVDRKALPDPNQAQQVSQDTFVAPRTPVEQELAQIWAKVLDVERVGVYDNFFELGGHSLLTAQLLSQVRELFQVELPLFALFEAPTVAELAQTITAKTHDDPSQPEQGDGTTVTGKIAVTDLANDAVLDGTIYPEKPYRQPYTAPEKILITGASGFLGAFLLQELLQHTKATVYCLVRAKTLEAAQQKIAANFNRYLLSSDKLESRVVPVLGDLAQPRLGLSESQYEALTSEIDTIYHNGAFVNLIYPYSALRAANVLGTQEILKLASKTKVKPVHFVSTLDVFQSPRYAQMSVILEQDSLESGEELSDGYAQSKWVGEKLVKQAHARGIPASIYRPGMITGHSQTGASQPGDLIDRLIKGLIQLGSAPELELNLSLTPVDYVSQSIVHLSQQPDLWGQAFHLVSPEMVSLEQLVDEIRAIGHPLKWMDYSTWQDKLIQVASEEPDNALSPLVFLFTQWVGENQRPYLETAALVSQAFDSQNTLAGLAGTNIVCPPVNSQVIRAYLAYNQLV